MFLAVYSLTWVELEDFCLALASPLISISSAHLSAASLLICGLLFQPDALHSRIRVETGDSLSVLCVLTF